MSRIEATGSYLPEKVVSNDYFTSLNPLFASIDEYFTGFDQRRHSSDKESGLFMAAEAAKNALSKSQYKPEDIDMILGLIQPSQHLYADDLNLVQYQIGAINASVAPVNTGCSSFLSCLNVADSLLKTGKKKCILIVTATDWVSNSINTEEPNYSFAGDGAGCVIVDNESNSLIDVNETNKSTNDIFNAMVMKNPQFTGKKEFFVVTTPEGVSTKKDLILFPITVAKALLDRNSDITIDKMITHQSGIKMIEMWAKKLGIDKSKARHTLNLYANMVSANVPVTLNHWIEQGDIQRGETLLFFTPSAGGHYIAMLWQY